MSIELKSLSDFLFRYIKQYREIYDNFTSTPPVGAGYPKLAISPFLAAKEFDVYLAIDGVVINELGTEPSYQWFIAGGPALKVDYEPSKTPKEVTDVLKAEGILGKNIGIYRIVAKKGIPNPIWKGQIQNILRAQIDHNETVNVKLNLKQVNAPLMKVVTGLTFGAYGIVLDIDLPNYDSPIEEPHIIKNFGVFPADLNNKRFFSYLEIHGQSDHAAWDSRTINVRVQHDLRRDFAHELSRVDDQGGGSISFGGENQWAENYTNRLGRLKSAIDEFRNVLLLKSAETENVFHNLIEKHPILLDVYGRCESKPIFKYPEGTTSPIGKTYVEPDFIVSYADQSYKLVELERASKAVATKQGQPRSEVGQAVFQTAEWVHYIKSHYQQIQDIYPGIHTKYKTCVVMSRSTQESFADVEDIKQYIELIVQQYRIDEMLTYDDLFERACNAYTILTGLSPYGI